MYEAGPTGFGLVRAARAAGIEMMVCAPGAIPRQPGDRVKTDTRDALKLARLHAAGQLRPVLVPEPQLEALRDLVRCREDLRGDLMACRHRITKLLLRRGLIYPGPGEAWSRRHASWLGSLTFNEPLLPLTFAEHLGCHEVLLARRDRLDRLIDRQASRAVGAAYRPAALPARDRHPERDRTARRDRRLRCLRASPTAWPATSGSSHPRVLRPDRRRQGSITKCGSTHARRLLVEAAWHYRRQPALSRDIRRQQGNQPAAAIETAWRAQLRLHQRWSAPRRRPRQKRTAVAIAVARELACFVWEIANHPTLDPAPHPTRPGCRWRPARAHRDPRPRYEHRPRSARSILDSGPSATNSTSCGTQPSHISLKRPRRTGRHQHPEPQPKPHRPARQIPPAPLTSSLHISVQLHPVSSLGLGSSTITSLQGGPDEQRPQELHLGRMLRVLALPITTSGRAMSSAYESGRRPARDSPRTC